jgi:hypothetical protein
MKIKYAIAVAPVLTLLAACQAQNTYIPYELGKKQKKARGIVTFFSGSRKIRLIAI